MARLARAEIFSPDIVACVHVMARVVRRCFLLGTDSLTASRTANLGTTWYRANALVSDGEGFWKSV